MELNLQFTTQTKILIGALAVVLIIAVAVQWGPELYGLVNDSDMENKRQTLQTSKDLVTASKRLKPVEESLFQNSGLSNEEKTASIFVGNYPETVIREKIGAIVKQAGIPKNYQMNMEVVPGKRSEKISPKARRNLLVYLYQNKLESERDHLNEQIEAEQQAEIEAEVQAEIEAEGMAMDMLIDAWLNETDEDDEDSTETEESDEHPDEDSKDSTETEESDEHPDEEKTDELPDEEKNNENQDNEETEEHHVDTETEKHQDDKKSDEYQDNTETDENDGDIENILNSTVEEDAETQDKPQKPDTDQTDPDEPAEPETLWEFASLPQNIPSLIQVELIELLLSMTKQYLVGAENTLFENQYFPTQKEATSGFLGFGAKEPVTEIHFRPNSQILTYFTELVNTYGEDLDSDQLTVELLEYLEKVQSQITTLSEKLRMGPAAYSPESYTVKLKFKAEMDKLVNLNRLIETTTKWLTVRDLQISVR